MKHYKLKSQVTIFIIIAVFVLIIGSIFAVVASKTNFRSIETIQNKVIRTEISTTQFNGLIQECLNDALDESLLLLGMQGGVIYKNQGGNFDLDVNAETYKYNNKEYDVVYLSDYFTSQQLMEIQPQYPCLKDDIPKEYPDYLKSKKCYKNFTYNIVDLDKYVKFGDFQKLDKIDMNLPLCSERKEINISGLTQFICDKSPYDLRNKYSWEEQIKAYIYSKMELCLDESEEYLNEELDSMIEKKGKYNISLVFSEDNVRANLELPLKIGFDKLKTSNNLLSFNAESDVRLKTIYSFIYGSRILLKDYNKDIFVYNNVGIVSEEMKKFLYNFERESNNFFKKFGIRGIIVSKKYDQAGIVIEIIDKNSRINGQPYIFNIRINNRPPALDYIKYFPSENYDVYLHEGDRLLIKPVAVDPDNDDINQNELIYSYEILDEDWKWRESSFVSNELYRKGRSGNLTCVHPIYGLVSKTCSGFIVNASDRGEHLLRVKVTDQVGESDWQDVRIFVESNSNLELEVKTIYNLSRYMNGSNNYSVVSEEDPFIMNFSNSVFPKGEYTNKIMWKDTKNTNLVDSSFNLQELSVNESYFIIPKYNSIVSPLVFYDYVDTLNKNTKVLNSTYFTEDEFLNYLESNKNFTNDYDILLKRGYPFVPINKNTSIKLDYYIHNSLENSIEKKVYVAECIPYRSDTYSYPFNFINMNGESINLNPYYSNHTCCSGSLLGNPESWKVKLPGELCFDSFTIGKYYDLVKDIEIKISDKIFTKLYPSFNLINLEQDVLLPSNNAESLDRYVRIVKGECDGIRGNICNPVEYKILKIPYCGMNYNTGMTDLKIKDTEFKNISGYYINSLSKLCVVINHTTNNPIVVNITEDNIINEKYVCYNEDGLPIMFQDLPCKMQQCRKEDTTLYPLNVSSKQINETAFFRPEQSPYPFCKCGSDVIDVSIDGDKYCCNPYGLTYGVHNITECNVAYPDIIDSPQTNIIEPDLDTEPINPIDSEDEVIIERAPIDCDYDFSTNQLSILFDSIKFCVDNTCRDSYHYYNAYKKSDLTACQKIINDNVKESCIIVLGDNSSKCKTEDIQCLSLIDRNVSKCNSDSDCIDDYYTLVAAQTRNINYCFNINKERDIDFCRTSINKDFISFSEKYGYCS